jgi:hypothetical protein
MTKILGGVSIILAGVAATLFIMWRIQTHRLALMTLAFETQREMTLRANQQTEIANARKGNCETALQAALNIAGLPDAGVLDLLNKLLPQGGLPGVRDVPTTPARAPGG